MRWFWFAINTSARVVWRGTWQAHSARLISGVGFAGLAAFFAYLATGRLRALVGILAYPAGLVLVYGFDVVRWWTGWHWRFIRETPREPDGALQVSIRIRGPLVILPRWAYTEDSCIVRDPAGGRFRARHAQISNGYGLCLYPAWFDGAPAVNQGTYWILWQERKPMSWQNGREIPPGKWRPVDFYRVKI
jgi:hypothetical protein